MSIVGLHSIRNFEAVYIQYTSVLVSSKGYKYSAKRSLNGALCAALVAKEPSNAGNTSGQL